MTPEEHKHMLAARLPDGPIWEAGADTDFDALLASLAGAASRVDDAADKHLLDFMPDTCGTNGDYIEDWARVLGLPAAFESDAWYSTYSDAQKQAIIIAQLRGRDDPTLANLETLYQDLFGDAAITLSHQETPAFECGVSGCTDGIGEQFVAVWRLRYMDNLIADPEDFTGWSGSVSANAARSPISENLTAELFNAGTNSVLVSGTADDDTVRIAFWYRGFANTDPVTVRVLDRNTDTAYEVDWPVSPTLWQKVAIDVDAGSGVSDIQIDLVHSGIYVSDHYVGIRNAPLEQRAQALAPAHTTGEFMVKGEDE